MGWGKADLSVPTGSLVDTRLKVPVLATIMKCVPEVCTRYYLVNCLLLYEVVLALLQLTECVQN